MGTFLADLHIHSRFSRATSKNLTFRHLAAWASVKGLDILGTGDFTHPGWLAMLEDELEPDEGGLFRLKQTADLARELPGMEGDLPCRTKFLLSSEISSIYKRGGRVRKVHNLVYMPDLDAAKRFNAKLAQVGNIASDGRPILGLDSRNLLEMVLETHPQAYLIPAHIWTPWFSVFGSKSGFDTLEECFGDLTSEIFALETGLSSDPAMNWLWSDLDAYALVSNSDAHSGPNLGREANIFHGAKDYTGIFRALKGKLSATEFRGTLEFYPEEGKYHLDGHRKCGVVVDPREGRRSDNICPVCGKPLTVGVLNRVLELADRTTPVRPVGHPGFTSLIPLPEIVSEIVGTGPRTKKVARMYFSLIERFGTEMQILRSVPVEDLKRFSSVVAEAVTRLREDQVVRQGGFDGQYGTIKVFSRQEREAFKRGKAMLPIPVDRQEQVHAQGATPRSFEADPKPRPEPIAEPNTLQQQAIEAGPGPVLVLAGPGTGKTHTLMGRVKHLLAQGEDPATMLVVTFTRRAAQEIRNRLALVDPRGSKMRADTLHAMAFDFWSRKLGEAPVLLSEEGARSLFATANPDLSGQSLKRAWESMNRDRELGRAGDSAYYLNYTGQKSAWNLVDYTDLLEFWLEQLRTETDAHDADRYAHVLVDEVQDLSPLQMALISALVDKQGTGFFAIGDPNQSIYGFRGAVADVQSHLKALWPDLVTVSLEKNYRSTRQVLDLAQGVFPHAAGLSAVRQDMGSAVLFQAGTAAQEAAWMGGKILSLVGGTAHWQADAGEQGGLGPGDIAVLVRFKALIPLYRNMFDKMGIPCAAPEAEAFFRDPRVERILAQAGAVFGIMTTDMEQVCPDDILARGPEHIARYVGDRPPFDRMFWSSTPFKKLVASYHQHGSWAGLLNHLSLESELEEIRLAAQKVQIMTLHGAKGLEFEAVFLPALEEGILPFVGTDILTGKVQSLEIRSDVDEERRLFYVGLTRAKQRVYLSHSRERKIFGHTLRGKPTRFLRDLPAHGLSVRSARAHVRVQEKSLTMLEKMRPHKMS
ncbi:UvrD-helicase domain-containing protein [Desulfoplanes formicivorans]|uniref:ATP-dependent DNA helicase UvrD n=1 Tax=Desulfoplanes formicivorans TaxID=1592317 RepID=A0A194AJC8_9BACT|nr:UvrD-helicase domain-containing protein [Desulfoplanes formicivorans]GAU08854.1 ATP-dependent DNA helicase UvrD [Desulfoplanes formicivorans]